MTLCLSYFSSSGIGRTGSFIALDRALQQAEEGVVDVMGIVNDMRQQRMKMVQTLVRWLYRSMLLMPPHSKLQLIFVYMLWISLDLPVFTVTTLAKYDNIMLVKYHIIVIK